MKLAVIFVPILFAVLVLPVASVSAINGWENIRVTDKQVDSSPPEIAADESGTAIVWHDDREGQDEIYFAKVNAAGNKTLRETRITKTSTESSSPVVAWNGKEYGVFWSEGKTDIYFTRVSRNGKQVGNPVHLVAGSGFSTHISAVWNGKEYGVVWWDARDNTGCAIGGNPRGRAYFMRVSSDGTKIVPETPVPTELSSALTGAYRPLIEWTGTHYGIFWTDQRESGTCYGNQHEIFYAKLDEQGNKVAGDIKMNQSVPIGNPHIQSVVWDGKNFGITFGHGHLYFARMDANGNTLTTDTLITNEGFSNYPRITWDGSAYAVAWSGNKDRTADTPRNGEIYFSRLDQDGRRIGNEARVTNQEDPSSFNSNLVFFKGRFRVAWLDQRDGLDEIYFAQSR